METNHFNGLSESEHERLSILMEECGEVVGIIGKIFRHGLESYHPLDHNQTSNRELLEKEIGDVEVAINMLVEAKDIDVMRTNSHMQNKKIAIKKYLHHQG